MYKPITNAKEEIKVGDILQHGPSDSRFRVTAIGETRILLARLTSSGRVPREFSESFLTLEGLYEVERPEELPKGLTITNNDAVKQYRYIDESSDIALITMDIKEQKVLIQSCTVPVTFTAPILRYLLKQIDKDA
jgi:hypothetical protein